ncbi:tRNA pseudouridine synthase B [Mycoplasmopsis californica HAZ160_1]|uniref:tRNA pseudouridine synthase B n=2 Tax=Mycoplasmopsis californica TaxID=2113 RepID=A0A059XVY7_9BACT|nr:tRNA pseudouridine(55) synthase TruB [Mycoplasmopsis californica]AIA29412.1 tRNA pseudouridine synthase B [Mycoplasmopsis californica]BAP01138.1 tRNA pseudouridine synthase B [Mycoplasmopsis californica HAZ160_1]BBG41004.1 tRNA pseudouridine synthase B [Mycoplasmopsis californica]BBG41597.1 tRNA pseudouridine synthase B [Mycoplasmopsis californica]BBG42191.1 tRNA pseudouridine synthase B [Mycoplasmopsis californica]
MFYLLHKPKNISSFACIKKFARQMKIKKIGHSGTLDPLASGLLLLATDDDTKLLPYIKDKTKTYKASIIFGQARSTYDEEGEITQTSENKINESDLNAVLEWFRTQNVQIPPIFSAKKINGTRAYDLARRKQEVQLKAQKIKIHEAQFISFNYQSQELVVKLKVSNGTYIRSLAHDIGQAFNTCSYMSDLERTEISTLNNNLLVNNNFVAIINVLPLLSVASLMLSGDQIKVLQKGLLLPIETTDGQYVITNQKNGTQVLGIIEVANSFARVVKLFGNRL